MLLKRFPLFLLFLFAIACNKTNTTLQETGCTQNTAIPFGVYVPASHTPINYNTNHCGYMPLGKKNYWIYLDSFFSAGTFVRTVIDTVRFTITTQTPDGTIWWSRVLSINSGGVGLPDYLYSTDSI